MLTSLGVGFYSYMWFKVFADTRKEISKNNKYK
jgi:hypothetical protein